MKAEFQITYFLWRARKDGNGKMPLYFRSKQNSAKQISYNTGLKFDESQWNYGTKKKPKNEPKNKPEKLITLERKLKETYKDLVSQGEEPSLELLLQHLNDVKKPTDKGIVAWCDDYLKSPYSEGQKKAVRTLKSNLAGTKKGKKKIEGFSPSLTFDKLTKPRLKAFFEFLTRQGVANNSQYKRLRAVDNWLNRVNLYQHDEQH